MFLCKYTSLLTGGHLTHKTSTGARTESADMLIKFRKFLFRHRTMPGLAPYDVRTVAGEIARFKF